MSRAARLTSATTSADLAGLEQRMGNAWASVYRRAGDTAMRNLDHALVASGARAWHAHLPTALASGHDWFMPDPDELIPLPGLEGYAKKKTDQVRFAIFHAVAVAGLDDFGLQFDAESPRVSAALDKLGQHITRVTADARQQVMSQLREAYDAGEGIEEAAGRIRAWLDDSQARGELVARTETNSASNAGSLFAAEMVGGVEKVWLATEDERTRETHAEADGQQVRLSAMFDVGGYPLAHPGDPDGPVEEVANCRCTITYADDDQAEEAIVAGAKWTGDQHVPLEGGTLEIAAVGPDAQRTVNAALRLRANGDGEPVVTAAAEPPADGEGPGAFVLPVMCLTDTPTDDLRTLAGSGASWREPPLTLMGLETTPEWGGHTGAVAIGRIDSIEHKGKVVSGAGVFSAEEQGQHFRRMIGEGTITGNSVDLAIAAYEWLVVKDGDVVDDPSELEKEAAWWGEDGYDMMMNATEWTVLASTVCPTPAFGEAKISLVAAGGHRLRVQMMDSERGCTRWRCWSTIRLQTPLTASAAGKAPDAPPLAWFETPEPAEPTAFTVTDEGRVFGHLAAWGDCHIGYPDGCVDPPRSASGYAYFHTGEVVTREGERVAVGRVTLGTDHPSLELGAQATKAHYDHSGTCAAVVRLRDGEHGPWMSGAVVPELDAARIAELRRCPPSGDWRGFGGSLELVAVLAVNVQGFPRPRSRITVAASGQRQPAALVAAGVLRVTNPAPGSVLRRGDGSAVDLARALALRIRTPEQRAAALARRIRG